MVVTLHRSYRVGLPLETSIFSSRVMLSMLCLNMRVILLHVVTPNVSTAILDKRKLIVLQLVHCQWRVRDSMKTVIWQIIHLVTFPLYLLLKTCLLPNLTKSLLLSLCLEILQQLPEIVKVLNNLKLSPGSGPDGLTYILLRKCSVELSYPLYLIFSKSMSYMEVPLPWKKANVLPLFKGGLHSSPSNYRPISMTSVQKPLKDLLFLDFMTI